MEARLGSTLSSRPQPSKSFKAAAEHATGWAAPARPPARPWRGPLGGCGGPRSPLGGWGGARGPSRVPPGPPGLGAPGPAPPAPPHLWGRSALPPSPPPRGFSPLAPTGAGGDEEGVVLGDEAGSLCGRGFGEVTGSWRTADHPAAGRQGVWVLLEEPRLGFSFFSSGPPLFCARDAHCNRIWALQRGNSKNKCS